MNGRIAVPSRYRERMPTAVMVLGIAGTVPFGAGALLAWIEPQWTVVAPAFAVTTYGAVILSFLGGTIWGITAAGAASDPLDVDTAQLFSASVVPALLAWGALFLDPMAGLLVLAAAFAAQLLADRWVARLDLAPTWWLRLRILLTSIVILCLIATVVALF
jgi:hypothetical protein